MRIRRSIRRRLAAHAHAARHCSGPDEGSPFDVPLRGRLPGADSGTVACLFNVGASADFDGIGIAGLGSGSPGTDFARLASHGSGISHGAVRHLSGFSADQHLRATPTACFDPRARGGAAFVLLAHGHHADDRNPSVFHAAVLGILTCRAKYTERAFLANLDVHARRPERGHDAAD